MRHFLPASFAVVLHAGRVVVPPGPRLLVSSSRLSHRFPTGRGGTSRAAVPMAVIAARADPHLLVAPRAVVEPIGVAPRAAGPRSGQRRVGGTILRDDFSPFCEWKVGRLGGRPTMAEPPFCRLCWYQSRGRTPMPFDLDGALRLLVDFPPVEPNPTPPGWALAALQGPAPPPPASTIILPGRFSSSATAPSWCSHAHFTSDPRIFTPADIRLEDGAALPVIDTVERIANALRISPCWLAFGAGSPDSEV